MHGLRIAGAALLLVFAISSAAVAADVEGLSSERWPGLSTANQCLSDLRDFDRKLAEVGFEILPPGGYDIRAPRGYYAYGTSSTPRQRIRALREAAYVYGLDGDEESCRLVLSTMRENFTEHKALVGVETDRPETRAAWRRAHLENAQPATQMARLMRANVVIGSGIRNPKDEKLAEISDIVLDPADQSLAYVLASRGGFLGIGDTLVALRWSDLRATEDHEIYVLNVSKEVFEEAPTVDARNFESTALEPWRREVDQFWEEIFGQ